MYALVEIKGKQYRVEKGSELKVDKLEEASGESVTFDSVLLVHDDAGVKIGTPFLDGVSVRTIVAGHGRNKKIVVYKYKRRKNYRRTQGHRQYYTTVTVDEISGV